MGPTNRADVQLGHDLFPELASELTQFGDWQVMQQGRRGRCRDYCLLHWLVHAGGQLGQDLVMCDPCIQSALSHPCLS